MKTTVRLAITSLAALAAACSGGTQPLAGLQITTSQATLQNDGTKVTLTARALDPAGNPGTGTVTFSAAHGTFSGGSSADGGATGASVSLSSGSATISYACSVASDTGCAPGAIFIDAAWGTVAGRAQVSLVAASSSGSDAGTGGSDAGTGGSDAGTGGSDAGTGVPTATSIAFVSAVPTTIITSDAANAGAGLPGSTVLTFAATDTNGNAVASKAVTFAEVINESLVTLSGASATTDANGLATVTVNSKTVVGTAHIVAHLSGSATPAVASVLIVGGPVSVTGAAPSPTLLGLKGSGIQEHGTITFTVADQYGSPVPGATVNFAVAQPALIALTRSSAVSDANGQVVAPFASASVSDVGVTTVTATLAVNGATGSRNVAVRGAKLSGNGFYFKCAKANLPTYSTVPEFEQTTCTARLSDRYGNRVGIATPVYFATEAGSITASAITTPFDPTTPDNVNEGTVTVTFTTDMGNGSTPAEVDPLPQLTLAAASGAPAAGTQYPWGRDAEPQYTDGDLVRNPRDQLVTIIAMARGEEGFVDSNHNGQLDPGEIFIDQGDPFIDANDDGVYDQIHTGGPWEVRFCSDTTNCGSYQGPNGKWDSDTLLWKPTWIVFTGNPGVTTRPPGGAAPASDFSPACIDLPQASTAASASALASIYLYDRFLNAPAAGGTWGSSSVSFQNATTATVSTKSFGFFSPTLDNWGAMGILGVDFDYVLLGTNGGPCVAAQGGSTGTACVEKLLFRDWNTGFAGNVELTAAFVATDTGSNACFLDVNNKPIDNVQTQITFTGAHGIASIGFQNGSVAP